MIFHQVGIALVARMVVTINVHIVQFQMLEVYQEVIASKISLPS